MLVREPQQNSALARLCLPSCLSGPTAATGGVVLVNGGQHCDVRSAVPSHERVAVLSAASNYLPGLDVPLTSAYRTPSERCRAVLTKARDLAQAGCTVVVNYNDPMGVLWPPAAKEVLRSLPAAGVPVTSILAYQPLRHALRNGMPASDALATALQYIVRFRGAAGATGRPRVEDEQVAQSDVQAFVRQLGRILERERYPQALHRTQQTERLLRQSLGLSAETESTDVHARAGEVYDLVVASTPRGLKRLGQHLQRLGRSAGPSRLHGSNLAGNGSGKCVEDAELDKLFLQFFAGRSKITAAEARYLLGRGLLPDGVDPDGFPAPPGGGVDAAGWKQWACSLLSCCPNPQGSGSQQPAPKDPACLPLPELQDVFRKYLPQGAETLDRKAFGATMQELFADVTEKDIDIVFTDLGGAVDFQKWHTSICRFAPCCPTEAPVQSKKGHNKEGHKDACPAPPTPWPHATVPPSPSPWPTPTPCPEDVCREPTNWATPTPWPEPTPYPTVTPCPEHFVEGCPLTEEALIAVYKSVANRTVGSLYQALVLGYPKVAVDLPIPYAPTDPMTFREFHAWVCEKKLKPPPPAPTPWPTPTPLPTPEPTPIPTPTPTPTPEPTPIPTPTPWPSPTPPPPPPEPTPWPVPTAPPLPTPWPTPTPLPTPTPTPVPVPTAPPHIGPDCSKIKQPEFNDTCKLKPAGGPVLLGLYKGHPSMAPETQILVDMHHGKPLPVSVPPNNTCDLPKSEEQPPATVVDGVDRYVVTAGHPEGIKVPEGSVIGIKQPSGTVCPLPEFGEESEAPRLPAPAPILEAIYDDSEDEII